MNFEKSFSLLIDFEGGYSNNPKDPGGETKFGISKRAYPNLNIKNLTEDQAKEIYKKDYWDACRCAELPEFLKYSVFDYAVNSGPKKAVEVMQEILSEFGFPIGGVDGIIGPKTMAHIKLVDPYEFAILLNQKRLLNFTNIKNWDSFGKGWVKRICKILKHAKE
jgi:lysozyme family protein